MGRRIWAWLRDVRIGPRSTSVPGGRHQPSFRGLKGAAKTFGLQSGANGALKAQPLTCPLYPWRSHNRQHTKGKTLSPGPTIKHDAHTHVVCQSLSTATTSPIHVATTPFGPGDRGVESIALSR